MPTLPNVLLDSENQCIVLDDGSVIPLAAPTQPEEEIDYQEDISNVTNEAEFLSVTIKTARELGWWHYHVYDSRGCPPGWPDLVLIKPPRIIFAELKMDRTNTRPTQQHVLDMLGDCGEDVYVWRPSDWPSIITNLSSTELNQKPSRKLHGVQNMYNIEIPIASSYDIIDNPAIKCVKCERKGTLGARRKIVVFKDAKGNAMYGGYLCESCLLRNP